MTALLRVMAIDGSPTGGGRTSSVLKAVLASAEGAGASISERALAALGPDAMDQLVAEMSGADAFVLGSPIYRASFAHPLKSLLDRVPRGMWGEKEAPLAGKPIVAVATGASLHHFLAIGDFRNVLAGFFAAHVLPPGLYVPRDGFEQDGSLVEPYRAQAALQGAALVELATALKGSPALAKLMPQA